MKAYGESILIANNDYGLGPTVYLLTGVISLEV